MISLFLPFLYYPEIIRKLGPDVYGIILLSQASVFFVSLFVDFGFNLSATKSVARNRLSAEKLANIVCLTILSKIILFSISMFIYCLILYFFDFDNKFIFIIALIIPFSNVFYSEWFFQGCDKMPLLASVNFFSQLTLFTAIFLIPEDYNLNIVAFIFTLPFFINGVLTFFFVLNNIKVSLINVSIREIKETMLESFPLFLSKLSSVGVFHLNSFLIGSMLGTAALAMFDLAYKLLTVLILPLQMLNQAIYPSISRSNDVNKVKRLILFLLPTSLMFYFMSLFFMDIIIDYYAGSEMSHAFDVYVIIALIFPISAVNYFLGNTTLLVKGYYKEFTASVLIPSVFYLVACSIFSYGSKFSLEVFSYLLVLHSFFTCMLRLYYCKSKSVFQL